MTLEGFMIFQIFGDVLLVETAVVFLKCNFQWRISFKGQLFPSHGWVFRSSAHAASHTVSHQKFNIICGWVYAGPYLVNGLRLLTNNICWWGFGPQLQHNYDIVGLYCCSGGGLEALVRCHSLSSFLLVAWWILIFRDKWKVKSC